MIPKIIHQVWIGPHSPPEQWMQSWPELNPDWRYKVWNETNFPFPLKNQLQYDHTSSWSGKVNILRYELLHEQGGLYMDCDSTALRPLDDELRRCDFLTVYVNETLAPGRVAPGILGSVPGHPILRELIDRIGTLDVEKVRAQPSHMVTGPRLLTRVIDGYRNDPGTRILPSHTFLPVHHTGRKCTESQYAEAYATHHWGTTHGLYG